MKLPTLIQLNVKARTNKSKAFLKILLITTGCICFVVLLSSLSMYFTFKNMFMEQSENQAIASFRQIEQTTDRMTETATAMAVQVLLDGDCSAMLTATNRQTLDPITNERVVKKLRFYRDINSYVHSIYLYNQALDTIYLTDTISKYEDLTTFPDTQIIEIVNHFEEYEFLSPIKRTLQGYVNFNLEHETPVLSYVVNETGKQANLDNAVIINISQEWLYKQIDSMYGIQESAILGLSPKGEVVIDYKNNCSFDWGDETAVKMLENAALNDTYSYEIEQGGERYYANYFKSSDNGWQYVKVSKWGNVFDGLSKIKDTAFFILAVVLLIALLLSILIAGNFYKTYAAVEKSYNRLITSHRGDAEAMRGSFVFDVLTGKRQLTLTELEAKLEKYNLPFLQWDDVHVIFLMIEQYNEFETLLGSDYIYDMKYGIKNIFEEVCVPYFKCVGIIEQGNTITFLATQNDEEQSFHEVIEKTFAEYCTQVKNFIDWEFTLLYADQPTIFDELSWTYHEMRKHDKDIFFYPAQTGISLSCIKTEHSAPLDYPTALEQRILKAIRAGNAEEAKNLYNCFLDKLLSCQYDNFITGMTLLCFGVTRLFEEYDGNPETGDWDSYTDLLGRIYKANKLATIDKLFYDMFDTLKTLGEQVNSRINAFERLDEVKQYICDNYQNPELSLETIAAQLSISSSYLRKTFRKSSEISIMEYINEVRVKKIAELLVSTEESAKDIAAKCGFYNANYFYTYFKKYYGLSPQVYRNKFNKSDLC